MTRGKLRAEYQKRYREKNKEKHRLALERYRKANIEKIRVRQRKYQKNYTLRNKDKVAIAKALYGSRRRALIYGGGGRHTQREWQELKEKYTFTCPSCRKSEPEIKLTKDHIIPISKKGSDSIKNIQPLCQSCNSKKKTEIKRYTVSIPIKNVFMGCHSR